MKKLYLFIVFLSMPFVSFGQGENNYWYFGEAAGINFAQGVATVTPTVLLNANPNFTTTGTCSCNYNDNGGCATVSKSDGSLLFYTDGIFVYNKLHQVMAGFQGFYNYYSSKQSAIIFQNPGNSKQYYIVSTAGYRFVSSQDEWGFWITLIDFSTNANGQIISTTHFTDANTFTCEGNQAITITKNFNGDGYWMLMPKGAATVCPVTTDRLLAYSIDNTGVISTTPLINNLNSNNKLGYYSEVKVSSNQFSAKVSTSGSLSANGTNTPPQINVYPFNRQTGQIGSIILSYPIRALSTEFSSDGNLLYAIIDTNSCYPPCNTASQVNRLVVFDLGNPTAPYRLVSNISVKGSLQRAIDGNIYFTNSSNFLYKIDNQNSFSTSAISTSTINLGRAARFGLPQLIPTLGWPQSCTALTLTTEPHTSNFTYSGYSKITTNTNYSIIQANLDIKMYARDYILLQPNTHIKKESKFQAKIVSCESIITKASNDSPSYENQYNLERNDISIYPNPTRSIFTMESKSQKIVGVEIYSIDGKLIYNNSLNAARRFELDVSNYSKGIYILIIQTDNGEKVSRKLIKE